MDLLFSRYGGGAEYVLDQEFELGFQIIGKAAEARNEDRIYRRWISGYDKGMGFEEFKANLTHGREENIPQEELSEKEILQKVKSILEMGK